MRQKPPRSILITGASSGIGEALALAYAGPGIFLALSGRHENRLKDVAKRCRLKGASISAKTIDAADRTAMQAWVQDVDEGHPLDLVIANAGVSAGTGGGGESEQQTRDIFTVNLAGVLNTVLPAIPLMRKRRQGSIAIMSSLAGFRGMPSAPAYSASKAAVKAYGEGLRGWLAADGIAVFVICPGFVESRMTSQNPFPMPFLMTAGQAASIIIKGLSRGRPLIAFPWPMYFAMRLVSALPAWAADAIFSRLPKKQ